MTPHKSVELPELPVAEISNQSLLWWGQVGLAAIEGSMFLILAAMYFYLRLGVDVWPPPGIGLPDLKLSTLGLVPLVLSAAGSYIASEGAKRDDRRAMIQGIALNLALAVVFSATRYFEWRSWNFTWASDAYGSILWTIMGLHTFDMVADLVVTAVLLCLVVSGRYAQKQRVGVHVDSVVWYFIVGIWIILYGVIYWGPRVVGTPQ